MVRWLQLFSRPATPRVDPPPETGSHAGISGAPQVSATITPPPSRLMLRSRPATPRVDPAPETGVHVGFAGMQQTRAADVAPTPRWLTLLGLPIRGDDPDAGFHVITEDGDFLVDESGAFVIHD